MAPSIDSQTSLYEPDLSWKTAFLLNLTFFLATSLWWMSRWPARKKCAGVASTARGTPFVPSRINSSRHYDTIVVGSGIGGCACANLLAQSGQRVLVLEQHYRTGGCTHSFQENGCEWDTGLHYTSKDMGTKTTRSGAIMHFITRGVQHWTELEDPYDEIVIGPAKFDSTSYKFFTGPGLTVDALIESIDPGNEELKKRAFDFVALCLEINDGFTALGISRVLPSCLHFLVSKRLKRLYKIASMTVRDVQFAIFNLGFDTNRLYLESCPPAPSSPDTDPILRRVKTVLTHPIGDYAVQPREASMAAHGVTMAHYSRGASYTVGPTKNISERATSILPLFGGEVFTNALVHEVIVENGRAVGVRVCEASAQVASRVDVPLVELRATNIVWSAGIFNLYQRLPQTLPEVQAFQDPAKRTVRPSNGHIYLFCKLRGNAADIGLPTHNLWYFNSDDLDTAFDMYFANPRGSRPPTVYIGFPCTKDTQWETRFPGVSNCILISDGLWEWFEEWSTEPAHNRGESYEAFKEQLSNILLDILFEVVPQVKGKVEFSMLGTPLTEVTYFASFQGGSYGTKCEAAMFDAVNRRWTTTPKTNIPRLFLAGSDAFLPSVCGAMHGGCFGAVAVLGYMHSMRLAWAFLSDFAASLKEDNAKLSWLGAYLLAALKSVQD